MCFKLIKCVDRVEEPKITNTFTGVFEAGVIDSIKTAAKIFIDNQIVEAVTKEVAKYNSMAWSELDIFAIASQERTIAITGRPALLGLDYDTIHEDVHYSTTHVAAEGRVILLKLKDFSYLAEYSLTFCDTSKLVAGDSISAELRLNVNVDSESGVEFISKYAVLVL